MEIKDEFGENPTLPGVGDNYEQAKPSRGTSIDRYLIVEAIGSGGMGTVYRAYNPKLNRGVALKILSVKQDDLGAAQRAKTRLIREAQALAQLSHPNVVAVHDYGSFGEDVFIAMELVEGKTLDEWIRAEKPSIKEMLKVMAAAGWGLSAAHKAGLVHRDFKPGNVIVGDDGRVRVLDFGLARAVAEEHEEAPNEIGNRFDEMEFSSDSSPNLLQSPLTKVGGVVGTPLYMAPEQHLGQKTDERTDQFGFCVVLYEALYGKRPFTAQTMDDLKSEVIRQRVCVPPADTNIPTWLWHIIQKGLSADPEKRHPTIESLLQNLEHDPEEVLRQKRMARRRRLFMVSLILLTIVVPIGVWYGLRYRTVQRCKAAEGEMDGVWDTATKESMRQAFLSTEKSFALGTWDRVERIFVNYLEKWRQMRSDVCEARLLHARQSEELFDLRMSCLRERLEELGALISIFTKADAGIVQRAVQASSSLSSIAICADEKALRSPYLPPKTTEAKTKVAVIRQKLIEVEAFSKTGQYKDGLQLAQKVKEKAKALTYRPVQAEVLYWLGQLLEKTGEYKEADKTLHQAAKLAGEVGDGSLAAKIMSWLVWIVGYKQARPTEGLTIGQYAEIVVGLSRANDDTRSLLFNNIGMVLLSQGSYDKSLAYNLRSLSITEKTKGSEHPALAVSLSNIGMLYALQGEHSKALEYFRKSLAIEEKALGPEHPIVAQSLANLGNVYLLHGEHDKALDYFQKAHPRFKKALGPNHPHVAQSIHNIGSVFLNKGEFEKAIEYCRKALVIWKKTLGADHPYVAESFCIIGDAYLAQGKWNQALEPLEQISNICTKRTCEPESHGRGLFGLARALLATGGNKERAIKLAKKSQEIFEKQPSHFRESIEEVSAWLKKHETSKKKRLPLAKR